MSKITDLIIEQIEQGQNALKREHNRLVNETAVEHGLHADDDRDAIVNIIMESEELLYQMVMEKERSDNE